MKNENITLTMKEQGRIKAIALWSEEKLTLDKALAVVERSKQREQQREDGVTFTVRRTKHNTW